jgi:hypothetical protein
MNCERCKQLIPQEEGKYPTWYTYDVWSQLVVHTSERLEEDDCVFEDLGIEGYLDYIVLCKECFIKLEGSIRFFMSPEGGAAS